MNCAKSDIEGEPSAVVTFHFRIGSLCEKFADMIAAVIKERGHVSEQKS